MPSRVAVAAVHGDRLARGRGARDGGVLCLCAYLARTRQRAAVAIEMENGIGAGLHANLILIPTVLLVPAPGNNLHSTNSLTDARSTTAGP
jgi:hypothetical protein